MPTEPTPGARSARCPGRLRRLLLLVALAAPVWAAPAASPPEIVITGAGDLPLQVERMALLRDPTRELDLADVLAPQTAGDFKPAPPGIPNLGTDSNAVWARFAVRNTTDKGLALLLVLADARLAQVAYWALDERGRVIAQRRDGRFADPAQRDRSHRCFLFELPLAAEAAATVYLHVAGNTGRRLDLRLTDRLRLAEADRAAYAWLALFFGALLFMLAYNLMLLIQLRDPAYLWLCCVIAGAIIWAAEREGLLTTLTWPLWPAWLSGIAAGPALGLTGIFMFPVAYLQLSQHAPRWVWVQLRTGAAGREPSAGDRLAAADGLYAEFHARRERRPGHDGQRGAGAAAAAAGGGLVLGELVPDAAALPAAHRRRRGDGDLLPRRTGGAGQYAAAVDQASGAGCDGKAREPAERRSGRLSTDGPVGTGGAPRPADRGSSRLADVLLRRARVQRTRPPGKLRLGIPNLVLRKLYVERIQEALLPGYDLVLDHVIEFKHLRLGELPGLDSDALAAMPRAELRQRPEVAARLAEAQLAGHRKTLQGI